MTDGWFENRTTPCVSVVLLLALLQFDPSMLDGPARPDPSGTARCGVADMGRDPVNTPPPPHPTSTPAGQPRHSDSIAARWGRWRRLSIRTPWRPDVGENRHRRASGDRRARRWGCTHGKRAAGICVDARAQPTAAAAVARIEPAALLVTRPT